MYHTTESSHGLSEFTHNLLSINSACLIFHTPSENSAGQSHSGFELGRECYIWFTLSCLFIFPLFTQTFLPGYCCHVWSPAAIRRTPSDFILCKRQLCPSHPQLQSVLECTQNSTVLGLKKVRFFLHCFQLDSQNCTVYTSQASQEGRCTPLILS